MKKIFLILFLSVSYSFFGQEILSTKDSGQITEVTEAQYNKMNETYRSDKTFLKYINTKADENIAGFVRMKELLELSYSEAIQKFGKESVNQFVNEFQRSEEDINIQEDLGDSR